MTHRSDRQAAPTVQWLRRLSRRSIIIAAMMGLLFSTALFAQGSGAKQKVLLVVTSNNKLKDGSPAGYYLPEAVDFYVVLKKYGYTLDDVDIISPRGGMAPMYQRSQYLGYPPFRRLAERDALLAKLDNTFSAEGIEPSQYGIIFYVGGFASLFDFPRDTAIANVARAIYERGGVIGAVCHGQSGLLPIRLSNGKPLVEGQRVTVRPIEEETNNGAITRDDVLHFFPFILEEKMAELGAVIEKGPAFAAKVVVSDRIVTGQNVPSATPAAEAIMGLLTEAGADLPDDRSSTAGTTLAQNEPNPFSASTVIRYTLPERSHVRMRLYDLAGRVVGTLLDGEMEAGAHSVTVDRSELADGVYLYRLEAGGISETRRMMVVR